MATTSEKFEKFVNSKRHISTSFLAFCFKNRWPEQNRLYLFDCRPLIHYDRICIIDSVSVNSLASILLKRLIVNGSLPLTALVPNVDGRREKFEKFYKTALIVLLADPIEVYSAELLYEKFLANGCDVAILNGKVTEFLNEYPDYTANINNTTSKNYNNDSGSELNSDSAAITTSINNSSENLNKISLNSSDDNIMKLDDLQPCTAGGGLAPLEPPSEGWNSIAATSTLDYSSENYSNTSSKRANLFNCRFPVQVMPNLYLGNAENASDLNTLKKNGIKYVLNVTPDLPNTFEKDENFKYMKIPVDDHWSENLSEYFPQAFSFIDEGRHQGVGVLVHCWAGISRSVTVTVAYLMRTLNLSMDDAYDRVKSHKPNIAPNFNFMGQLLDYERDLYGENVPGAEPSSLSNGTGKGGDNHQDEQQIDENSLLSLSTPDQASTCR